MEVVYPLMLYRRRNFLPLAYIENTVHNKCLKRKRQEPENAPIAALMAKAREMVLSNKLPDELPIADEIESDEVLRNTAVNALASKLPMDAKIKEEEITKKVAALRSNELAGIINSRMSRAIDLLIDSGDF